MPGKEERGLSFDCEQSFEFIEFIIFKDSPTGKNPDRGGLHREVVRK